MLDAHANLAAAADASGVHELYLAAIVPQDGAVDVSGSACPVGDDGLLFFGERIEERALADVRAAEQRDADAVGRFNFLCGRNVLHECIEQFTHASVLGGAGWEDGLDAEPVKALEVMAPGTVNLVDDEEYWLAALQCDACDAAVFFADWDVRLNDDPYDVGAVDGLCDLFLDGELELVLGRFHAGGVDQPKIVLLPARLGHHAVTSGTSLCGHDSLTALEDSIKQAALAHVGTANNSHDRKFFRHIVIHYNRGTPN